MLMLIQVYPQDSSLNLNRLDNPVNNSSREEKMQKYRDIKKLEDKIRELERRVNVEEEVGSKCIVLYHDALQGQHFMLPHPVS